MFCYIPDRGDLDYYAATALGSLGPTIPCTNIKFTMSCAEDPTFAGDMRRAFEFIRTHGDGHYTSNSLMQIIHAADRNTGSRSVLSAQGPSPWVLSLETPYTFDEETEVKTGGTLGMLVQLNNGTNRAMLAVASGFRRAGVAKGLLVAHYESLGYPSFWLAPSNVVGQHFLLDNNYQPVEMNRRGALCWRHTHSEPDDDGSE